jgi:hypothetical protein
MSRAGRFALMMSILCLGVMCLPLAGSIPFLGGPWFILVLLFTVIAMALKPMRR